MLEIIEVSGRRSGVRAGPGQQGLEGCALEGCAPASWAWAMEAWFLPSGAWLVTCQPWASLSPVPYPNTVLGSPSPSSWAPAAESQHVDQPLPCCKIFHKHKFAGREGCLRTQFLHQRLSPALPEIAHLPQLASPVGIRCCRGSSNLIFLNKTLLSQNLQTINPPLLTVQFLVNLAKCATITIIQVWNILIPPVSSPCPPVHFLPPESVDHCPYGLVFLDRSCKGSQTIQVCGLLCLTSFFIYVVGFITFLGIAKIVFNCITMSYSLIRSPVLSTFLLLIMVL